MFRFRVLVFEQPVPFPFQDILFNGLTLPYILGYISHVTSGSQLIIFKCSCGIETVEKNDIVQIQWFGLINNDFSVCLNTVKYVLLSIVLNGNA